MPYDNKNATYALNSYLWKLLEANLGWKKSDYEGKTPIVPIAQQPEMLQSAKPFIVYGSARHPSTDLYALVKGAVSYNIYSTSSTEADKIAGLIATAFARQDEAADDVNGWLAAEAVGRGKSRDVAFGTIRTVMVNNAEPADEEGGFVSALVMLEIKYTEQNNSLVTTGFTWTP